MNVGNWLSVFIVSLLAIGALGYGASRLTRRATSLWNMMSLGFAGLICATMFATLSAYSPAITTAVQAAAQPLTCVGTPPLVRAGDEIAVTGLAPADSTITLLHGENTLATATADGSGAFAATITLSAPGLQSVNCQVEADGQTNTIALSFLVIGQAAAPAPPPTNTPEPTATNSPEPTATNTTEPTATETAAPTVAPPVVDTESIPEQLLPGDTFRLRGTADGGARVRVAVNNRVVAGAVAGPQGSWRTTIGFARSGEYTLTAQLVQDDAVVAETEPIFLTVLEPTPTPEPTATNTTEPTATNTTEPTATNTAEPTATNTPTPAAPVVDTESIPEQLLPGDTFRLRGTADGGARVRVAVNNRVVAGAVAGPQGSWRTTVGFARSGEYTLTAQLVQDDVVIAESEPIFLTVLEPTPTPEPTATNTPEPTATNTPEPTATNTPEPTATNTPEPTATNTPEPTATNTPEPTATNTPEPTATNTPEPTATNTPEPTATNTPEPTATNTPEPTATNTPEPTATNTPEPTATNTPEPTATNTPEPTATNTPEPVAPVVDTASIPEQLLPGDTFRLRGTAAGGARVRVAVNDRVVAGAVAGPQGSWRATVGFARAGEYTLTVQLVQEDVAVAVSEPVFLTVLEPTPTAEPTPTTVLEPTPTAAAVDASQPITTVAPIDAAQPVTTTAAAPGDLPGTGSDFSGGVPWVVLILLLGAALTLGMGRLSNKPTI
jgi:type VI secretion system secreted protein VgrG